MSVAGYSLVVTLLFIYLSIYLFIYLFVVTLNDLQMKEALGAKCQVQLLVMLCDTLEEF